MVKEEVLFGRYLIPLLKGTKLNYHTIFLYMQLFTSLKWRHDPRLFHCLKQINLITIECADSWFACRYTCCCLKSKQLSGVVAVTAATDSRSSLYTGTQTCDYVKVITQRFRVQESIKNELCNTRLSGFISFRLAVVSFSPLRSIRKVLLITSIRQSNRILQ